MVFGFVVSIIDCPFCVIEVKCLSSQSQLVSCYIVLEIGT